MASTDHRSVRMDVGMLLMLLVLPGSLAGTVGRQDDASWLYKSESKCASLCTGSNKFQYSVGKSYQYKYEVNTITSMHGASEGAAQTRAKAIVHIDVIDKCEMMLSLSDVSFQQSVPNRPELETVEDYEYKLALTGSSLRFSFQDGRVEELCLSEHEDPRALNFKRGVLSAFQNSMTQQEKEEHMREVDVTGTCPTHYSVSQRGWKSVQFMKVKDLLGCSDRHDYRTALRSTPFHLPNTIQSLPLLKGSHKCNLEHSSEGHMTSSNCVESLVFRPFSKKEAGATTETTQKLNYHQTVDRLKARKEPVRIRTNLLYKHLDKMRDNDQTVWTVKEKLAEFCRVSVNDISQEVPGLFTQLVYLLRGLDSQEIMDIWERVHRGSICQDPKGKTKKFFLDALPMAGTSSSVEVMVEMLLAKEVKDTQADLWITSFNFIQNPDPGMISQLKRLLQSDSLRKSSLLPVSSLVNNFCDSNPGCLQNRDVDDIVNVLGDILGKDCQGSDEDVVLSALRAIGNLGYSDALVSTLERCSTRNRLPLNVRVMAVQAYRGLTCQADRQALQELFMNKGEDAELRINAYLGIMQCTNEIVLEKVHIALASEEVSQVGSFVWTHLTNLAQTASPHKQGIKQILEDQELKKEFDLDKRKYSRNYEISYFSEKFGLGAMAESNVIWSSKSFLPRSAMVNLTVDVLGHSVNLVEVGGRVEGLEALLQSYLGEGGIFERQNKKKGHSSRCGKQSKLANMKKKFSVESPDPSASVYLRMFGNELGFKHFTGKDLKAIKNKLSVKDILSTLARGYDVSFTQNAMFMDATVSVPTIAGMALRLSVNGTMSVELTASGKLDARKLNLKRMEAALDLRPSGAVELSGLMTLDAGVSKAGLKMATTLHSSTAVSGSLVLTNGQVLSIELDTPSDKMEIFDMKSEFFIIHNTAEEKQQMIQEKRINRKACSPMSIQTVLGYEMCGEVSFINASHVEGAPYFPFTGPMSASLILYKRDIPRGVKFTGNFVQNKATSTGHLSINTPGSSENRAASIGYFLDIKDKSLEAELQSPWKKLLVKGSYMTEKGRRMLTATVLDDGLEYKLYGQVDQEKQGSKTIWTPLLELSRPDNMDEPKRINSVTAGGTVEIDSKVTDITTDLTFSAGEKSLQLKGDLINKPTQRTLSGTVTLNKKNVYSATFQLLQTTSGKKATSGKLQPTIIINLPSWKVFLLTGSIDFKQNKLLKGNLQVNMENSFKKPTKLEFKITKQSKKNMNRYRGNAKLTSQFAVLKSRGGVTSIFGTAKKGPVVTSKVTTDYALPLVREKKFRKNKIVFSSKYFDRSTKDLKRHDLSVNMDNKNFPEGNIAALASIAHKERYTKSALTVNHGPKARTKKDKNRQLTMEMNVNHKLTTKSALVTYNAKVEYPLRAMEYQFQGKHEHHLGKQVSFENYNSIIFARGKNIEVRLIGKDSSKKNLDASGSLEIVLPSFENGKRKTEARNYKLLTSIKQRANKEYLHTVNLQTNNGKHTMVTKFLKSGQRDFTLFSEVDMGNSPNKVRLDVKKVRANMDASVKLTSRKGKYNMEVSSEERGYMNRIISWDFDVPERRIKGSLEGMQKKVKNNAYPKWIVNFVTAPDFNREPSKKIEADLRYFMAHETKEKIYDFAVNVMTPYKNAEIFTYERTAKASPIETSDYFKVVWGNKEKELSSSLWMHLPPSVERFEMKYNLVTPSEKVRNAGFDIVHKFDSKKYLSSSIKVMHNNKEFSLALLAANKGDLVRNDFEGSLQINSNFKPSLSHIFLELKHNDDGRIYSTEVSYNRNGLSHKAILQATYVRVHWQAQINADLEIQIPRERPMTLRFKHMNTLTNLNSSLTFIWNTETDAKLNIGGKFNKAEKDYALDILYNGPVDDFTDFELQYRHNEMGDMRGSLYHSVNKNPTWTSTTLYKYSKAETSLEFNGHDHSLVFKVSHSHYPYTLFISNVGPMSKNAETDEKIVLEASLDKDSKTKWSTNLRLLTPFDGIRNIEVRGSFEGDRRDAQRTDWTLDGTVEFDVRKEITVTFTVDPKTWTRMHGTVKTPFDKLTLLSFGFDLRNSGKLYNTKSYPEKLNFDSYLEMQPLFSRSKMEFSTQSTNRHNTGRLFLDMPDTEMKYLEINTEVTEVRRGAKTNIKVNYHPDKEIDMTFKGRFNKNRFPENTKLSLDLVTPYKVFPTLNMNVNLEKEKGKWLGDLNMVSTADHFKHLDIHVEQEHSETSCHSDIAIASSLFETIEGGMHFDWGDTAAANVTLRAPSVGRTMIGFKRHSESWTDFQNKVFAEFNGYSLDADVGLKHDDMKTKAWILFAHPGSDDSYVDINVHRIGNSMMDFDIGGFLQVGKNSKPFNVSTQFSHIGSRKNAIGFTLATPTTKDLSYLVKFEIFPNAITKGKLYAKYGKIFLLDFFSEEKKEMRSIEYTSGYHYKFYDTIVNSGSFYSVKWSETFHEGIVKMNFLDHKLNMEVLHNKLRDGLDTLDVSLTTPWEEFTDIGLEAKLKRSNDHIKGSGKLEYMNDNEAELTFDLKPQSGNTVTLTSELLLPVEGYEQNTLTYSQTSRRNAFTAEAEVITGKGEHLNGNLRLKNKSEFDLKLEGPIEDFESLVISGTYNADQIKLDGDAHLKLRLNPKPVSLEYNIHVNKNPVDVHFKLTSPYKNIRNVDWTITHRGKDWKKFTTISELRSEVLGTMESKTMWDYDSPTRMEGRSMFTSEIENFENLKVGFATKKKQADQVSSVTVSWAKGKEVAVENAWRVQNDRKKAKLITSLDVTSPFEEMKKINVKLSHTKGQKAFSEEIFIHHNDRTYLDTDISYQFADGHEGTVDIRSPRPMSLLVTGKGSSGLFDGKIKFVWDKRSPDSQVVIESKLADQSDSYGIDKSLKFKVIHPVRIMGVDCMYKNDNSEVLSSGLITWDEEGGKTFSYDLGWSNRTSRYSKMYSGHLKLGVPHRSVKVQGSYEDQGKSVSTSHAVFWDADKDDTKKVVLATTQETRNKMKRVSVNLNLPSINKQLNIGVSNKEGYGSTLMDCKAEVSYSSDPSKMLVVTSKLTNAVDMSVKDQYNYTLDLSLVHPVTDTNFQITSHLASVDGTCSSGSQLTFLTAQKEKQSLGWWGRWNRRDKKAELQVVTPLKTVGIEGVVEEVGNRQHFLLKSFEDGQQALKFGALVDPQRRNMRMEFNYDQDDEGKMVALSGRYVDDSAMEFDVVSYDGRVSTSESMITVRLNSSHILHTRILWRPSMLSDLKTFIGTKVTAFSYAADLAFKQSVATLGTEVKAKYVRVSEELREELSQVFELMEKEMDSLSSQLETLRIKARRFYQRNDLRIRDMSENLKEMVDQLLVDVQKASRNYRNYYKQVTQATQEWLVDLKTYPISQRYTQAVLDFITALKETRQLLEETLDSLIVEMQKFSDVSYKKYLELSRSIDRKLNSYKRLLIELPMYKKMLKQREDLAKLGEKTIPNWAHIYDGLYLKGQELLQDQFHDMMTRDEFKHAHALATEIHQQFMYWNTEKSLSLGMQRLISMSKNLILMEVAKLKGSFIDMKKSRVIVFDPERGELQLEIHLPIGLKSLSEPPQLDAGKYLNKLKAWTKTKLPATNASIWDNDYIPSLEPETWVPPYDATGYVIGSQQLVTFDKTSHSYLSSCSHVLARDMLYDKFLVTANYERNAQQNGIKSVCVTVDELSIEVGENYKVLVNNREVEMPYITDRVRVLRSADSISVEYTDGLDVVANPKLDLYKVKISGWYHGRTAGLLGMYDNEKVNEKDLSDFAQDFDVNKRSCNNKNVALTPDAAQDKNGLCHQFFKDPSSKFRPCFRQVSSKPFFELCQMYMATKSEEKAVYQSTEQYRSVCQDQGVYMGALKEYEHVPCSTKTSFKVEGSDPRYQSADVVFIVEDSSCNKWTGDSLAPLVTELNKELTAAGMKKNQFGLIGFGGVGMTDATVRTLNGHHFGQASVFLKAVETLSMTDKHTPGDIFSAIELATKYPFRPGVAKILVLAPCISCDAGYYHKNADSILKSQGFVVHALRDMRFPPLANRPGANRIYGMDATHMFTNQLTQDGFPKEGIVTPTVQDDCQTILAATNGSLFDTRHLIGSPRIKREFMKSFAQHVAWRAKLPDCQQCQCDSNSGQVQCSTCQSVSYLSFLPSHIPSLPEAMGTVGDFGYDVKNYFGYKK